MAAQRATRFSFDWHTFHSEMRAHVKARADLVAYLHSRGVALDRSGRAPCPVHGGDSPPSFHARCTKGEWVWTCYSRCGTGDLVSFLIEHDDMEYVDAIREASALAGLDYEHELERAGGPKVRVEHKRTAPLRRAAKPIVALPAPRAPVTQHGEHELTILERAWAALDLEGEGIAYLDGRGIPSHIAHHLGLRSATMDRWRDALRRVGASRSDVERAGLLSKRDNLLPGYPCPFLVLPYWTPRDGMCALRFRRLDGETKLKTMSQRGSCWQPSLPYLAHASIEVAIERGSALFVTEGEFDALSCVVAGHPAIAIPGAKTYQRGWSASWGRLRAVIVLADSDEAGRRLESEIKQDAAIEHGTRWLRERLHIERGIREHKDANDALRALGAEGLARELTRLIKEHAHG